MGGTKLISAIYRFLFKAKAKQNILVVFHTYHDFFFIILGRFALGWIRFVGKQLEWSPFLHYCSRLFSINNTAERIKNSMIILEAKPLSRRTDEWTKLIRQHMIKHWNLTGAKLKRRIDIFFLDVSTQYPSHWYKILTSVVLTVIVIFMRPTLDM